MKKRSILSCFWAGTKARVKENFRDNCKHRCSFLQAWATVYSQKWHDLNFAIDQTDGNTSGPREKGGWDGQSKSFFFCLRRPWVNPLKKMAAWADVTGALCKSQQYSLIIPEHARSFLPGKCQAADTTGNRSQVMVGEARGGSHTSAPYLCVGWLCGVFCPLS